MRGQCAGIENRPPRGAIAARDHLLALRLIKRIGRSSTIKIESRQTTWVACFRRSLAPQVSPEATRRKHGAASDVDCGSTCFRRVGSELEFIARERRKHATQLVCWS